MKKLDESARLRALPYLRGRIIRLDGAAASELEAPPGLGWVLRGERALTWIADDSYIGASRVVAGKIWDENESRPQASFDAEAAAAFGVGDRRRTCPENSGASADGGSDELAGD